MDYEKLTNSKHSNEMIEINLVNNSLLLFLPQNTFSNNICLLVMLFYTTNIKLYG